MDPNQFNEALYERHSEAARRAVDDGNTKTSMEHNLEGITLLPTPLKNEKRLLQVFHGVYCHFIAADCLPLSERIVAILKNFLEDDKLHIFLVAEAAGLLGFHYRSRKMAPETIQYFERAILACKSTEAQSYGIRNIRLDSSGKMDTLGELMDYLVDIAEAICEETKDPRAAYMKKAAKSSTFMQQPEVAEEGWKIFQAFSGPSGGFFKPPTLTSELMEKVKGLPETGKTFLIVPNILDESAIAIRFGCKTDVTYGVLQVNLARFHSGEREKVFRQVQVVKCESDSIRQKNLLGALVVACQFPCKLFPASPQSKPAERPQKVLLPSAEDANHPQVALFLSMMGCTDVDAADPALLKLLADTPEVCGTQNIYPKKQFPCFHDHFKGKMCGNCKLVGPALKRCVCGKAYYCSTECQTKQWKAHKKEHKAAMKKAGNK